MNNSRHNKFPTKKLPRMAIAAVAMASLVSCNSDTSPEANQQVATTAGAEVTLQTSTTLENVDDEIKAQAQYQANNVAYLVNDLITSNDPNSQSDSSENQDGITNSVRKFVINQDGTTELYTAKVQYYAIVSGQDPNPTNAKVKSVLITTENITKADKSQGNSTATNPANVSSISLVRVTDDNWQLIKHDASSNTDLLSTTETLRGGANPNVVPLTAEYLAIQVQVMSSQFADMKRPGVKVDD